MTSNKILRGFAALGSLLGIVAVALSATVPPWWTSRNVLTSTSPANDYAAVNLGQVKHIATQAQREMQARLPGGAGATLTNLVNAWTQPPASGVVRNDFAAVNLGQLKALAKPFYDRLAQAGYQGQPLSSGQTYPWTASTSDDSDYAIANIGQVKFLFSFYFTSGGEDSDGDGMGDDWERYYFGNLNQGAAGDSDGDGLSNAEENQIGTDPTRADTDADGRNDRYEHENGTNPMVSYDWLSLPADYHVILKLPDNEYAGVRTDWTLQAVTP